jgi:hypothetical protein
LSHLADLDLRFSQKFYKLKREAESLSDSNMTPTTPTKAKTPNNKATPTTRKRKGKTDGQETPGKRPKNPQATYDQDVGSDPGSGNAETEVKEEREGDINAGDGEMA